MQDKLFFVYLPILKSSLNIFWLIYCMCRFVKHIFTPVTGSITDNSTTTTIDSSTATTSIKTVSKTTTATTSYSSITDNIITDNTTTSSNNDPQQRPSDYGPLHECIIVLEDWIQKNGLNKISAISSRLIGMQSYVMFAKDVLLELVATDRSTRLQPLINYILDKDTKKEESVSLATALASIIMMCFENVASSIRDQKQKSLFFDVLPMLTNAIRACPDTFICDFMLFNITNFSATTFILNQDLDDKGNNTLTSNKKLKSDIINGFLENNDFMAPPLPNDDGSVFLKLCKRATGVLKRKLGCDLIQKDAQLIMFEHYSDSTLKKINQIKRDLWDVDLYYGPNAAPPIIVIPPSPVFDSIRSYSTGTPPSISAPTFDSTSNNDFETIISKENYDYKHDAGEYEQYKIAAHLLANFEDEVLKLRNRSTSTQARIEELLSDMDTFNNMHELAKMGLTLPAVTKRIVQLQKAFRSLITSFQQYREYVFQYEKGFTFYQIYKFVDRFETDALNCRDDFRAQIRESRVDLNLFNKLENKSDLFISMTYNLRNTLQRFVNFDLDYRKEDYMTHAEELEDTATVFALAYGNEFCNRLFRERIFSETYHHENSRVLLIFHKFLNQK